MRNSTDDAASRARREFSRCVEGTGLGCMDAAGHIHLLVYVAKSDGEIPESESNRMIELLSTQMKIRSGEALEGVCGSPSWRWRMRRTS
ncbi:MAG: hypothetical protein IPG64_11330 [Haliea sp.]|nr:hypothetical protein [Haliea sp.]